MSENESTLQSASDDAPVLSANIKEIQTVMTEKLIEREQKNQEETIRMLRAGVELGGIAGFDKINNARLGVTNEDKGNEEKMAKERNKKAQDLISKYKLQFEMSETTRISEKDLHDLQKYVDSLPPRKRSRVESEMGSFQFSSARDAYEYLGALPVPKIKQVIAAVTKVNPKDIKGNKHDITKTFVNRLFPEDIHIEPLD